jgi:hypothetical protein
LLELPCARRTVPAEPIPRTQPPRHAHLEPVPNPSPPHPKYDVVTPFV